MSRPCVCTSAAAVISSAVVWPYDDRKSADLAAGELAGDAAALIDVAMIAFDLRFGAGNEFAAPEHRRRLRAIAATMPAMHRRSFSFERLAQAENVVPALQAGQRLDDDGKGKLEIVGLDSDGMKLVRRRHRQAVTPRQVLEPRLVEQIFDQGRIGDDEAKRLSPVVRDGARSTEAARLLHRIAPAVRAGRCRSVPAHR